MTNAIYLIIAGALLGPIESQVSQMIWDPSGKVVFSQAWAEAKKLCDIPKQKSFEYCIGQMLSSVPELKSIHVAETCERAMKEIGAEQVFRYAVTPPQPAGIMQTIGQKTWAKDGTQVLCIPAPSGLKR